MDKLELDDRVRRLEQRLSIVTALIVTAMMLFVVSALVLLRTRGETATYSTPTPAPPMTATVETRAFPPTPVPPLDMSAGSVGTLGVQLRELDDLRKKGLLNEAEFGAKKAQLLARPIHISDFGPELQCVAGLQQDQILTAEEHTAIRKKILEDGK